MDRPLKHDLSGEWHGQYTYPRYKGPVHFTTHLIQTASWFTGRTEEIGTAGRARGVTITATLQGRLTGQSVIFLKIYDGEYRGYDSVQYSGAVNEDATEIEGTWTISNSWSGKFLMIRPSGLLVGAAAKATEKV